MKYEWQDSFFNVKSVVSKDFIKKIFKRLNKGTPYTNDKGKFYGYITAIDGPLNVINVISDHSLETEKNRFIGITVTYLGHCVLYLQIDNDHLIIYEFNNGWWANKI